MAIASNLGFPRIGVHRELKRAVEGFWRGDVEPDELQATARGLRRRHWQLQRDAGIEHIPSGDFSLYDHVLDTMAMVGAIPQRFHAGSKAIDLATYFAMARGGPEVVPLDMTKWFDTNYHYLVPEFEARQSFRLASTAPVDAFSEATALGIRTRPVLLGPVSFLLLGKSKAAGVQPLGLLERLLPIYEEMVRRLARAGAEWVQIDEPVLALDLAAEAQAAVQSSLRPIGRRLGEDQDLPDHLLRRSARQPGPDDAASGGGGPSRPGPRGGAIGSGPRPRFPAGDVVAGRDRRPQHLAGRSASGLRPAGEGGRADWRRAAPGRPLLLALALPHRPGPGGRWRRPARRRLWRTGRRAEGLAGLRQAETRRDRHLDPRPQCRPARRSPTPWPRARPSQDRRSRSPRIHRPEVQQRLAAVDATMLRRRRGVSRAAKAPAGGIAAAAAAHHDHRLVPPDGRGPQGAGGLEERRLDRGALRGLLPARDRA